MQNKLNKLLEVSNLEPDLKDFLRPYLDIESGTKAISPRGNGKTIKTNKPKDYIWAYIWRMARFNGGIDMSLPVMAEFDLHDGIKGFLVDTYGKPYNRADSERNRGIEKTVGDILELYSRVLLTIMGVNANAGLNRWTKALTGEEF